MPVCQQQPTHAITIYHLTIHFETYCAPAMGPWKINYAKRIHIRHRSPRVPLPRSKRPAESTKDMSILVHLNLVQQWLQSLWRPLSIMGTSRILGTMASISRTRCSKSPPCRRCAMENRRLCKCWLACLSYAVRVACRWLHSSRGRVCYNI